MKTADELVAYALGVALARGRLPLAHDEEIWRTNKNGQHYLIDTDSSTIAGGMGGELNGVKIDASSADPDYDPFEDWLSGVVQEGSPEESPDEGDWMMSVGDRIRKTESLRDAEEKTPETVSRAVFEGWIPVVERGWKSRTTRGEEGGSYELPGTERTSASLGYEEDPSVTPRDRAKIRLAYALYHDQSSDPGKLIREFSDRHGLTREDLEDLPQFIDERIKASKEKHDAVWKEISEANRKGKRERRQREYDAVRLSPADRKRLTDAPLDSGKVRAVAARSDSVSPYASKFLIEKGNGYLKGREFEITLPNSQIQVDDHGNLIGVSEWLIKKDERLAKIFGYKQT